MPASSRSLGDSERMLPNTPAKLSATGAGILVNTGTDSNGQIEDSWGGSPPISVGSQFTGFQLY